MVLPNIYIIDFDSTFTKVEALDELAKISLANSNSLKNVLQEIEHITQLAMNGELAFDIALEKRIQLLSATKQHITQLITILKNKISDSFLRNKNFILENKEHIYIVSGGFTDYILPIVTELGVKPENTFANEFIFDEKQNIIGFNKNNLLAQDKGKVKLLQQLQLQGDICVIGDGYTDYELKEAGLANTFYMFTENIAREKLKEKADKIIGSLDEFLFMNNLNRSQFYPKNKIKVLLLENVHQNAIEIFRKEGFQLEIIKEALDENELIQKIKDIHILCIRSKTQVTEAVLANANRLMCIGAFCIGTNQINKKECLNKGIVVFNAPYSNTRSVVELAVGEMIMLMRNIFTKSNLMHRGVWDKTSKNSFEIRGKVLGLIGYGNIGSQFSVIAEALGMQVYFYDTSDKLALGNAKKCNNIQDVLKVADVVSLHVDGRDSNTNIIGEKEFELMKNNVIFMNLSRGHIVDLVALKNAILSGKVWGTSVDVFPYEPKSNDEIFESELLNLPNTILTPHIGGSTEEAQANIGEFVPYKILNYINKGDTYGAVNFPEVQLPSFENSHRLLHIHENVPGMMAKINAVFAEYNINIQAQYLKTYENIGYVITDISKDYDVETINALKQVEHTIKFRMLY